MVRACPSDDVVFREERPIPTRGAQRPDRLAGAIDRAVWTTVSVAYLHPIQSDPFSEFTETFLFATKFLKILLSCLIIFGL